MQESRFKSQRFDSVGKLPQFTRTFDVPRSLQVNFQITLQLRFRTKI
jgi:hypothetical protein